MFCRTVVAPDGLTKLKCDVPAAKATALNYTGDTFAVVRRPCRARPCHATLGGGLPMPPVRPAPPPRSL
jgi:hypothetical protein